MNFHHCDAGFIKHLYSSLSQVFSEQVLQALTFKRQDSKPDNVNKVDCKMLALEKNKLKEKLDKGKAVTLRTKQEKIFHKNNLCFLELREIS